MREILFRGKRVNDGKWVEGYYIYHIKRTICPIGDKVKPEDEQHVIMCDAFSDWNMPRNTVFFDIDPNTLGQYTGLKDINGRRVFEGDIVRHYNKIGIGKPNEYCVVSILWEDDTLQFIQYNKGDRYTVSTGCVFEVIGNIYDNSELVSEL